MIIKIIKNSLKQRTNYLRKYIVSRWVDEREREREIERNKSGRKDWEEVTKYNGKWKCYKFMKTKLDLNKTTISK